MAGQEGRRGSGAAWHLLPPAPRLRVTAEVGMGMALDGSHFAWKMR